MVNSTRQKTLLILGIGAALGACDGSGSGTNPSTPITMAHGGDTFKFDPAGSVARQFDVRAMPTSVLIDRNGKVRVRHAGFKDKHRAEREQQIVQLLKEPAA